MNNDSNVDFERSPSVFNKEADWTTLWFNNDTDIIILFVGINDRVWIDTAQAENKIIESLDLMFVQFKHTKRQNMKANDW